MTTFYLFMFLKLLLFLLLPGLFWLYFFAGQKDLFKSPMKSLLPVFFMGVLVCVPALAIEYFCVIVSKLIEHKSTVFTISFFIVGPLEEYLKSLAVDIGGYSRREDHKTPQILAWYFTAAIGFASIENVLYYFVFGSKIFFYRVLITTLAHIACSGVLGYFIGLYKNKEASGFARGFFIAMIIHGAYDYFLNIHPNSIWIWVPLFLFTVCYLESKLDYQEEDEDEENEPEKETNKELISG